MREERAGGPSRVRELLADFLSESAGPKERYLERVPVVSSEVRADTRRMLDELEAGAELNPVELHEIPRRAVRRLEPVAAFYRLWGETGPPELEVAGNEPVIPERRKRVVELLQLGLECVTRDDAADLLDRLGVARESIPGLDYDFACWLYLLAPNLFPPLPAGLFPGAGEVLSGVQGLKDTVRRIWGFSERHAELLGTDDLAVPTAFLRWLSSKGSGVWSRPRAQRPYYGLEQLTHETMTSTATIERLLRDVEATRCLLLTGVSGTGKTFTALRLARYLVRDGGSYEVLRAHPGLGYAQLVGYHPTPGVLLQLAATANRHPEGTYVLLLDAIDESQVEQLLGEVALALEYPEEQVTTAGGFRFNMPPNLLLLATARRPWEELLQESYRVFRLFAHTRLAPDPARITEFFNREGDPLRQTDVVVQSFRKVNRLLAERSGGKLQLGHGYLMVQGLSDANLATYWNTYIIPYLRSLLRDPRLDEEAFQLAQLA